MKVLLHYFSKLTDLGGVVTTVRDLATGLREHGCETAIVEMAREAGPKWFMERDIPVWTVAMPSDLRWERPRSWASNARSVWQFRRAMREFRPDIVHVHFPCSQLGILNLLAPLPRKWRMVATVQNSEIRCLPKDDQDAMRPYHRFYERVDSVTAVNPEILDEAIAYFPCIRPKSHLILNGVSDEWFEGAPRSNGKEQAALFVGRLEHIKGIDILLEAWQLARGNVPWKQLHLAGDGSKADLYRKRAVELGIADSVVFLGRKSQMELRDLYRDAGIVILPSRKEGLPFTLLEAGACSAICIATDIPGNRDIVCDRATGFLVEPESAASLAHTIVEAGRVSPDRREAMRIAARNRIRTTFAAREVMSAYARLFRSLL